MASGKVSSPVWEPQCSIPVLDLIRILLVQKLLGAVFFLFNLMCMCGCVCVHFWLSPPKSGPVEADWLAAPPSGLK